VIHLPEFWNGYLIDISNISHENQVLPLKESREVLQKIITKSERFFDCFTSERNIFILHPGGMTFEKDILKNNKFRLEALHESLNKVKTVCSEIFVENLPPFPWYFGGQWNSNIFMDAVEIDKFCQNTKRKICYDVSHSKLYCNFSNNNLTPKWLYSKDTDYLHIADATGIDGEGLQIDKGEINFDDFFTSLKGWNGCMFLKYGEVMQMIL